MRTSAVYQNLSKIMKKSFFSDLYHISYHNLPIVKNETCNFLCFHLLNQETGRVLSAISPALWEVTFKSVKCQSLLWKVLYKCNLFLARTRAKKHLRVFVWLVDCCCCCSNVLTLFFKPPFFTLLIHSYQV